MNRMYFSFALTSILFLWMGTAIAGLTQPPSLVSQLRAGEQGGTDTRYSHLWSLNNRYYPYQVTFSMEESRAVVTVKTNLSHYANATRYYHVLRLVKDFSVAGIVRGYQQNIQQALTKAEQDLSTCLRGLGNNCQQNYASQLQALQTQVTSLRSQIAGLNQQITAKDENIQAQSQQISTCRTNKQQVTSKLSRCNKRKRRWYLRKKEFKKKYKDYKKAYKRVRTNFYKSLKYNAYLKNRLVTANKAKVACYEKLKQCDD